MVGSSSYICSDFNDTNVKRTSNLDLIDLDSIEMEVPMCFEMSWIKWWKTCE